MLKLKYIVYTVIVGPFSFLNSQVAGVGGRMVVIIGGRTLQIQRFILNFIAKSNPLIFYDLYRVKLLFIRGVATIVYCVSAALESILRLFLLFFIVVNTARTSRREESFWQLFVEKVVKENSIMLSSNTFSMANYQLLCLHVCLHERGSPQGFKRKSYFFIIS